MPESANIQFEQGTSGPEIKPDLIFENEREYDQRFDPDYITFINRNNGGRPVQCLFENNNVERMIDMFLCMIDDYQTNPMGDYDIGVVYAQIWDRLDTYLIPFATLFAGDILCFDYRHAIKNPEKPRVVIWYHESSTYRRPTIEFVSYDFKGFLAMLYSE